MPRNLEMLTAKELGVMLADAEAGSLPGDTTDIQRLLITAQTYRANLLMLRDRTSPTGDLADPTIHLAIKDYIPE